MKEKLTTIEGGSVAMAGGGEFVVGANPFGFGCAECGAYHDLTIKVMADGWQDRPHDITQSTDVFLNVERNEEETRRLRAHLGEESSVVKLQHIILKQQQLLADWASTADYLVNGIGTALDAIGNAIAAVKMSQADGAYLSCKAAEEVLLSLLPEEKKTKGLIVLNS